MLAGPKWAIYGPNEPPPAQTGPSRTIARLIRERPVFVNLAKAATQAAIPRPCRADASAKTALKSSVSGILGEPAVRRCRRLSTLPQRGFFETAHLARIYPRLRGFPRWSRLYQPPVGAG